MSDDASEMDTAMDRAMERRFGESYRQMRAADKVAHDAFWQRERVLPRNVVGFAVIALAAFTALMALTGCEAPINPVRYQTVEVLVTRPCFAGRTPPAEATTLTTTTCTPAGDCAVTCSDARPEACVTHAAADILELQREARQYRNLFKECSK